MQPTGDRLYTPQFLLLCLSHVLFAGSFNMIIPELPAYLASLGGEDYKGLIIALFTLTAGLSRPFSGKLTDTVGRVPVMIFGALVCVCCSLLYPLLTSVAGFLLLRLFHGFSTGFKPTASSAYVADIAPVYRRGEAMGILGVSMNIGASLFPPVGSWLAGAFSLNGMFFASSGLALVSILILLGLKETLEARQRFSARALQVSRGDVIEPKALAPSVVIALSYVSFGTLLTIVPDQCAHLGMANKGLFFTSFTAFSVLSRLVAGRASDRYGRVPVLKVALLLSAVSLAMMGNADTPATLLAASGALGFSTGIVGPAAFAWVIDRSPGANRGRALATAYIALEIGIGMGALFSAWAYDNNAANFPVAFYLTALMSLLGFAYVQLARLAG
ncbi:MAG: MFS transporter [Lewinellaceae bacterium]|nr:MFS transporter [Lewinellaceae bacterium]